MCRRTHFQFAQGRQVDGDCGVAAGPVFLDWPCGGIGIGQPVAAIFGEVPRERRKALVEGGLLGQLGGGENGAELGGVERAGFLDEDVFAGADGGEGDGGE